jgi:TolB-like protein
MGGVSLGVSNDRERPSAADRLDSWKEIGEYLKRSVRTVRRWEAEEALPVHRHHHRSSDTVYAFKAELDEWFAAGRLTELEPELSDPSRSTSPHLEADSSKPPPTTPRVSSGAAFSSVATRRLLAGVVGIGFLGVALLLLYRGAWRRTNIAVAGSPGIQALAVLPLANLTGDPAQDYFVDGMTEALITELAQHGGVRVISRTSVIQYKAAAKPLRAIARELSVDGIVDGAVVRSGGRVRINAQLIDARSDRHLWASSYERDLDDVIQLQREVARAIGEAVSGRVMPPTRGEAQKSRKIDRAAYEALLRAQKTAGEGTFSDAIRYCENAIEKQPDYAEAYALMALYHLQFEFVGGVPPQEYMSRAKAAARKALELDETLADAHAVLATVLYRFHWNWSESEKEFRRALELNPNYSIGHRMFSAFLRVRGRIREAVAEAERARQLDPLSVQATLNLVAAYRADAQFERAIAELRTVSEKAAKNPLAHLALARVYVESGKLAEATAEMETGVNLAPDRPMFQAFLGYTYGLNGRKGDARRIINEMSALAAHQYVSPAQIGLAHLAVAETDTALSWFKKAVEQHDPELLLIISDGGNWLGRVRSDARFQELLKRFAPAS